MSIRASYVTWRLLQNLASTTNPMWSEGCCIYLRTDCDTQLFGPTNTDLGKKETAAIAGVPDRSAVVLPCDMAHQPRTPNPDRYDADKFISSIADLDKDEQRKILQRKCDEVDRELLGPGRVQARLDGGDDFAAKLKKKLVEIKSGINLP